MIAVNAMYLFSLEILSLSFHWQTDPLFCVGYIYCSFLFHSCKTNQNLNFSMFFFDIYVDILQKQISTFQDLVNVFNYSFKYFLLKSFAAQFRRSFDQKIRRQRH